MSVELENFGISSRNQADTDEAGNEEQRGRYGREEENGCYLLEGEQVNC